MTINQAAHSIVSDILEFLINRTEDEDEPQIFLNDLEGAFSVLAELARDVRTMDRFHCFNRANLRRCSEEMRRRHQWKEC